MRKILLAVLLSASFGLQAQVFDIDTLQYRGDGDRFLNFVIMGDGYTATQQDTFHDHAVILKDGLLSQSPFSNYTNYINVFAIRVISNESGAKHPDTAPDCNTASPLVPVSDPDNYFGSSFDCFNIHRLIVATKSTEVAAVLVANIPNYDYAVIVANTPYYGGSGGSYSTISMHTASTEIVLHECGHSFAGLADEYYAGDVYFGEKPNMTRESDRNLVKWSNWVGADAVGVYNYCCGGKANEWYRPHRNCKMEFLGSAFCNVCRETIIEKIHSLVNPVVSYTPVALNVNPDPASRYLSFELTELMRPIPNTLRREWLLDGKNIALNTDSVVLDQRYMAAGTYHLVVNVVDTTQMQRVDFHDITHVSSVSWVINKTTTSIDIKSAESTFSYSVYPNPSGNVLHIAAEGLQAGEISVEITTTDGKTVKEKTAAMVNNGVYDGTISVEDLASGAYFIVIRSGNVAEAKLFIKQ